MTDVEVLMSDDLVLHLPGGRVHKVNEGRGRAVGMNPLVVGSPTRFGPSPGQPKRADWRVYVEIFERHAIVRAAIDTLSRVATNTGYDFVPIDSRAKAPKREVNKLKSFFNGQADFMVEMYGIYQDLMIFGDAYLNVVYTRGQNPRPLRLKRLAPYTIQVEARRNGEVVRYWQRDPQGADELPVEFAPHEMLHFRIPNPIDDIYGLSPLESLKQSVATDLFAQSYNRNFFKNSAVTGTILTVEGATREEIDRNRKWLLEDYVGTDAAHRPMVLEGNVKVHQSTRSHHEMGFLEGRKFIIMEILAVLGVPPVKLGMVETANRSNSKEQDKSFRAEMVQPLQTIVESVINGDFVRGILNVHSTKWVHSEGDARDAQEQMELWTGAVQNGILNINEIRGKMGHNEIPGGDINYVMTPTGAVPVVDLELYFQLPMPNTDRVPADSHGGHGHPEGRNGVGPNPDSKVDQPIATGLAPASKSVKALPPAVLLRGALGNLGAALDDDKALRAAYGYCVDLQATTRSPLVGAAIDALEKSMYCATPMLRQTYVERAEGLLSSLVGRPPADAEDAEDAAA